MEHNERTLRYRFPGAGTVQLARTKGTKNKQMAHLKTRGKVDTK